VFLPIGFVLLAVYLTQVETLVHSLEKDSKFLDTVLEIRRYEKNWILYKKVSDFETARQLITTAHELLNTLDPNLIGGRGGDNPASTPEAIKLETA
jgi:hypothetical protein